MSDNSLPSMHFQDPKITTPTPDTASDNPQIPTLAEPKQELEPLYVAAAPNPLDEEPDVKYIIPFFKFY